MEPRAATCRTGFVLPFVIQARATVQGAPAVVRSLRLRIEGGTRNIAGRSILCSRSTGDGYVVDEFTQKTPNIIIDQQCLAPAVITHVSLVRVTGGPPLKEWVRSNPEMTPEGPDTAVIMAGSRLRAAPPILQETTASSPNATAPLPKRP